MKKTLFSLILALFVSAVFSNVWHVNNIPGMAANFINLEDACASSAVANYDTLYVYGSPTSYNYVQITRPLTIIGPGYFLGQNPGLQNNLTPATVNGIIFDVGSSGSLISGMTLANNLSIYASNVVVQRNCIDRLEIYGSNCIVLQNFISNPYSYQYEVYVQGANYLISNNYIPGCEVGNSFYSTESSSGIFSNNIVEGSCNFFNADIYNCIFSCSYGSPYGWYFNYDANTSFHHNVFRAINFWDWITNITGESNLYNVWGELYVASGSQDGYFQLCPGSPAIGAGINGQDCGIFGGLEPYRLSGIPAIPTIYQFIAPSTGFVIPVQIKARSNN